MRLQCFWRAKTKKILFQHLQWIVTLAFLVYITIHIITLNLELQVKFIFVTFGQITVCERKRQFQDFLKHVETEYGYFTYFPYVQWLRRIKMLERVDASENNLLSNLQNHKRDTIPDIFVSSVQDLRRAVSLRFANFRQNGNQFKLFGTSYKTDVE